MAGANPVKSSPRKASDLHCSPENLAPSEANFNRFPSGENGMKTYVPVREYRRLRFGRVERVRRHVRRNPPPRLSL